MAKNNDGVKQLNRNPVIIALKPAMLAVLKSKGVNLPKKTKAGEVAVKFYDVVVLKKASFENFAISAATVSVIVAAIAAWFRTRKEKKEAGEALSPAEEKAMQLAEAGAAEVQNIKQEETQNAIGEFVTENGIFILIGIVLLFALMKK